MKMIGNVEMWFWHGFGRMMIVKYLVLSDFSQSLMGPVGIQT